MQNHENFDSFQQHQQQTPRTTTTGRVGTSGRPTTAGTRRTATTAPAPASLFHDRRQYTTSRENETTSPDDFFEVDNGDEEYEGSSSSSPPPPTLSAVTGNRQNRLNHQHQQNNMNNNNNNIHNISMQNETPNSAEVDAFSRTLEVLSKLSSVTAGNQQQHQRPRPRSAGGARQNNNNMPTSFASSRSSSAYAFQQQQQNNNNGYEQQPQQPYKRPHSARRNIDEEFNNMFDPRGTLFPSNNRRVSASSGGTRQNTQFQFVAGAGGGSSPSLSSQQMNHNENDTSTGFINNISISNNNVNTTSLLMLEQTQADLERVSREKHDLQRAVLELQKENEELRNEQQFMANEIDAGRQREAELEMALENGESGGGDIARPSSNISFSEETQTSIDKALFIISKNFPKPEIMESFFTNNHVNAVEEGQEEQEVDQNENNGTKQLNLAELINFLADRCIELCAAKHQLAEHANTHLEMMELADEWEERESELLEEIEELMRQSSHKNNKTSSSKKSSSSRKENDANNSQDHVVLLNAATGVVEQELSKLIVGNKNQPKQNSISTRNNQIDELLQEAEDHTQELDDVLRNNNNRQRTTNTAQQQEQQQAIVSSYSSSSSPSVFWGVPAEHWSNKPYSALTNVFEGGKNNNSNNTLDSADLYSQLVTKLLATNDEKSTSSSSSSAFDSLTFYRDYLNHHDANLHPTEILVQLGLIVAEQWQIISPSPTNRQQQQVPVPPSDYFDEKARVDRNAFTKLLQVISQSYFDDDASSGNPVFFHSSLNAANILVCVFLMLTKQHEHATEIMTIKEQELLANNKKNETAAKTLEKEMVTHNPSILSLMPLEERLAIVMSACAIFIGHPNLTDEFLVKTRDPIAIRFYQPATKKTCTNNNNSILSNYHIATLLSLDEAVAKKVSSSSSSSASILSTLFNQDQQEEQEEAVETFHQLIVQIMSSTANNCQQHQIWKLLDENWNTTVPFDDKLDLIAHSQDSRSELVCWLLSAAKYSSLFASSSCDASEQQQQQQQQMNWINALKEECANQKILEQERPMIFGDSNNNNANDNDNNNKHSCTDLLIRTNSTEAEIRSVVWLFDSKLIPLATIGDQILMNERDNFLSFTSQAIHMRNTFAKFGKLASVSDDFDSNASCQQQVLSQSRSILLAKQHHQQTSSSHHSHHHNKKKQQKFASEEEVAAMKWSFGEIQKSLLQTISEYQTALSEVMEEKKQIAEAATELVSNIANGDDDDDQK